jgi:hypothetical protein
MRRCAASAPSNHFAFIYVLYIVPSKTEIYPNFESLIYQDVILLQTPRQVIERDPAMCRILSMIAARL